MRTATQVIAHLAMPRRWLAIVVLLASIITLAGCDRANGDSAKDGKDEVPAVPVEVATTQRAEMAALYSGTAPIEADRRALVMPKVSGEIRAVLADEGQRVKAGQVLARLHVDNLKID
jgi:multidrug efflux pump subunit AcrA (membrane-fusion protein)